MTPNPELLARLEQIRVCESFDFPIPDINLELDIYQRRGIAFFSTIKRGILADDTGLGKTLTALGLFSHLRHTGAAQTCVVVCPSTAVLGTWKKEILKNTSFNPIILLGETAKGPRERSRIYGEVGSRSPLLVTNYEIFRRDYKHPFYKTVGLMIYDESSYFKGYHTATAEAVRTVSGCSAPYSLLLNATPYEISALDIFSQVDAIYPGYFGSMGAFQARYCTYESLKMYKGGRLITVPKITGSKNIDELRERINWLTLKRDGKDVGIVYADVETQLLKLPFSPQLTKVYDELKSGLLNRHGYYPGATRKVEFGVKFNYMLMACISPCLVTKEPYVAGESPKFDAIFEMAEKLKEAGERFVVFSRFRQSLMLLESLLKEKGYRVGCITGRETKQERLTNQDALNDGILDVLLINMSGARSLNLQTARFLIFLDSTFNPSTNKQVIGRLVRRTQLSPVVYIFMLLIDNSIDEKVMGVIEDRQDDFDTLFSSHSLSIADMERIFQEDLHARPVKV